MSDKQYFLITVAFKTYGIKYLVKIMNDEIASPDWKDDDERWFSYRQDDAIVEVFKRKYKETINRDFDGRVLFIEPHEVTLL